MCLLLLCPFQRARCLGAAFLLSVCLHAAASALHVVLAPQGSVGGAYRLLNSDPMRGHVLVRRAASDEDDMAPPLPQRPARPILPPRAVGPPPNGSPQHIFIPIHDHNVVKFPGFPQPPAAPSAGPELPPRPKTTEEADPGLVYNFADPSEFSVPRPEDVINGGAEGGYITLSPAPVVRSTPPIILEPPPYPFDVLKPPESPLPPAFRFPDSPSTSFRPPPNSPPPSKIRFPASNPKANSQQFDNVAPSIHPPFSPPSAKTQKKESADSGQRFTNFFPPTRFPQKEVNSESREPIENFKDSPQDFPSKDNINNFPIPTGSQFSEPLLPNDSGSLIPFGFGDDFFITGDVSGTGSLTGTGVSGTSDIFGTGGTSEIRDIIGSGPISGTSAERFPFVDPQPKRPKSTTSTTSHPSTSPEKQNPISYQIQSWQLPSPKPLTTELPPVIKTEIIQLKPFKPQTTLPLTTEADDAPPQTPVAVQQNQIPEQQFSNPLNPSPWPTSHQEQNPTPAPPHWLNDGTSVSRFETTTSHQSPQTFSETSQVTENPWPNAGHHQSSQPLQGNFVEDSHVKKRENKVPASTSTFDPLPAFSAEDLGSSGSTSLGFFPYENSDDFFNEVFKNSNPFGAKIVAEVTPSSNRISTLGTLQESQVQTSRTGLSPQLSTAGNSASTPSFKRLPSTTSPARTQTYQISIRPSVNSPVSIPHSAATSFSHQQFTRQNFVSPSTSSSQPSTNDPFTALLSNHQLSTTPEDNFVPVRSLSNAQPSFSGSSTGVSTSFPASFQSAREGSGGPSSNYQGVSNLLANDVQRHIVPSSRGPSTTRSDHQPRTLIRTSDPFSIRGSTDSSFSSAPTTTLEALDSFPSPESSFTEDQSRAPVEDNAPSTSTTTTTTIVSHPGATEGKVEVLVLPYKKVEEKLLEDTSPSFRNPDRSNSINFGVPLKPVEEEVSVYLVRQERPTPPRGFPSPTPPTPQTPPMTQRSWRTRPRINGEILQSNEESVALGQEALEFRGFPIPLEFKLATSERESESRQLEISGAVATSTADPGGLPSHFAGTMDPAGFEPSRDFESSTSLDSSFEFVGPATLVGGGQGELEEDLAPDSLQAVAPPPSAGNLEGSPDPQPDK
ncbi:hypothetical protein C7M84_012110 [Penaeus vannamei]|uniref:Uncharacterized protein n=1 Tax=Penaeus vannamei TaxID=6689 RepID=A0A423T059_PENVA|nr:hypothetical protein C7M84_012110 [Penaeus vannamei]